MREHSVLSTYVGARGCVRGTYVRDRALASSVSDLVGDVQFLLLKLLPEH